MIRFELAYDSKVLLAALNQLGRDNNVNHQDLSKDDLGNGLLALGQSAFNYGLLDPNDEQHLMLLYYWLVQVRTVNADKSTKTAKNYLWDQAREQRKQEFAKELYQDGFYKLAILGAGSAAAYYVNALGEGYDHRHTLLLGEPDPWRPSDHPRSRGDGYINHEAHLISQWGKTVPKFSTTYVPRSDFADENATILERIETKMAASVKLISLGSGLWIRIDLSDGKRLWTQKVVVATGAGPHANRGFEKSVSVPMTQVMDLDEFMRAYPSNTSAKGKSVIVHGPNAGIDAVERAGECGFDSILWFMSESSSPVLLSGNRLKHAPYVLPTKLIERNTFEKLPQKPLNSPVMIDKADDRIKVSYVIPGGTVKAVVVDLYVYALGQDGAADGAVGKVLEKAIKDNLVPIYDIQGRFTTAHEDVIVGFQMAGTTFENGVEIIGAAANVVANPDQRKKMLRVAEMQPGTVLTADQLGTIKSAIGSQNAVMPRYVGSDVNLSTDDRTVLRTHMAIKYPNIDEEQATRIIEAILASRRTTDKDMTHGYHPLGYDAWWQRHFRQVMEYWNAPRDKRQSIVSRHNLENQVQLEGRHGFLTED